MFFSRTSWSIFLLDNHSRTSCLCVPGSATVSLMLGSPTMLIEIFCFRQGFQADTTVQNVARLPSCYTTKNRNTSSLVAIAPAFCLSVWPRR